MAEEICPDEGPDAEKFQFIEFDDCADLDALGPEFGDPIVIDNCEGFEAFEADPDRYQIVEIVSEEAMECQCCGCECCGCNGYWTEYTMTISGVVDDPASGCDRCADMNGSWLLSRPVGIPGCVWKSPLPPAPFCTGTRSYWELQCGGPTNQWALSSHTDAPVYLLNVGVSDDCSCDLTLSFAGGPGGSVGFCIYPTGNITLTPGGTWQSCGAPAPDCGALLAARAAMTPEQQAVHAAVTSAVAEARRRGPGTELKKLLGELGFAAAGGCGCDSKAARMNRWGVAGCLEHRDEIIAWLRGEQSKQGWVKKAWAAVTAVFSGIAFRLDPTDPAPGLFNEAIRRAGQGATSSTS